jgi:hypothetical protein
MRRLGMLVLLALVLLPVSSASAKPADADKRQRIDVAGRTVFAPVSDEQGNPLYVITTPLADGEKCLVSILATVTFSGSLEGTALDFLKVRVDRPCDSDLPPGGSTERGEDHGSFSGTLRDENGTILKTGTFGYRHTFTVDDQGTFRGRTVIVPGTGDFADVRGVLKTISTREEAWDNYSGRLTFGE